MDGTSFVKFISVVDTIIYGIVFLKFIFHLFATSVKTLDFASCDLSKFANSFYLWLIDSYINNQ